MYSDHPVRQELDDWCRRTACPVRSREGAGSSPAIVEQKENFLKAQSEKKRCKMIKGLVGIRQVRPPEVVANTNPAIARMGASPIPQSNIGA